MTYFEASSQNFLQATGENDGNSFGIIFTPSEIRTGHFTVTYNCKWPSDGY
jgi:hypothetical protein